MSQNAPRRSSLGWAFLAALAVGGSAVAVMVYQLAQKEKPAADTSGFDIAKANEDRNPAPGGAPTRGPTQSGLEMVKPGGADKMSVAAGGNPASARQATKDFTDAIHQAEGQVQALAISYTKRFPSIAQYGRDWMSYPDLKKLNDKYMNDHNPIKFLRGLAQSKNFGRLVAKYAADPAIQSFVKENMSQAPRAVTTSAMGVLKEDGLVKDLVSNTASALGLPPAMTSGLLDGGKVDRQQVMGQIIQDHPELQQSLQKVEEQNSAQPDPTTSNSR